MKTPTRQAKAPAHDPASAVLDELRPGQSVELLQELHILTRDGRVNQDSRRKLKQVYHLCQFIGSKNPELNAKNPEPNKPDSKTPGGDREEPAKQLT